MNNSIGTFAQYKNFSAQKRPRSKNKKCPFKDIGCSYNTGSHNDIDNHSNDLSRLDYHNELLLKRIKTIEAQIKELNETSFHIEKMLTNFPALINVGQVRKRINKKISVQAPYESPHKRNTNNEITESKPKESLKNDTILEKCKTLQQENQSYNVSNQNNSMSKSTIHLNNPYFNPQSIKTKSDPIIDNVNTIRKADDNVNRRVDQTPKVFEQTAKNLEQMSKVLELKPKIPRIFEEEYYLKILNNPIGISNDTEWSIILNQIEGKYAFGACIVPYTFTSYYLLLKNAYFPSFIIRSDGKYINNNTPTRSIVNAIPYKEGDIITLYHNKRKETIILSSGGFQFTLDNVYFDDNEYHKLVPCVITSNLTDKIQLCGFNDNPKPCQLNTLKG